MKCPICGSKMKDGFCVYCKISSTQVENASNKEVSKARKEGRKNEIYYSTTLPKDINVMRLRLLTIFLGWCGVNSFYVKRNLKGLYSVFSIAIFALLFAVREITGSYIGVVFQFFFELFMYASAINIVLWIWDIIALFLKSYKVPVVLGEKQKVGKYDKAKKDELIKQLQGEIIEEVSKERKNNTKNKKK